ncbi:MAG: response regulator [Candidatus Melainabacteria bacterium]|nr:MAG: response regulator [Candidatus Melainabacteria bacterium]
MPQKPKRALSLVKKTDQKKSGSDKSGPELVLIVEDNEVLRRLFLSQLKVIGLVGHEATNGKEAVEAVSKGEYGLILMDVSMPVMDGLEATKLIRENEKAKKRPRVPIIAVTGISDRDTCLQSGMDDFMNKPFLLEHLRGVVGKWMKHRA